MFASVLFDTPLFECLKLADSTYSLKNYATDGSPYRLWFPHFQRTATHTGTLTKPDGVTTVPYRAVQRAL